MNRYFSLPLIASALFAIGCDTNTDNVPSTNPDIDAADTSADAPDNTAGDRPGTPEANGGEPVTEDAEQPAGSAALDDAKVLSILMFKDHRETAVGRLAQQKALSDEAKQLADMLVTQHTEHAEKVRQVAESADLTLLTDDDAKRELDRLKGGAPSPDPVATLQPLEGAEFDRTFGELMARGHSDLIRLLEDARPRIQSQEVRGLIDETIPVLREHEEMARAIDGVPAEM